MIISFTGSTIHWVANQSGELANHMTFKVLIINKKKLWLISQKIGELVIGVGTFILCLAATPYCIIPTILPSLYESLYPYNLFFFLKKKILGLPQMRRWLKDVENEKKRRIEKLEKSKEININLNIELKEQNEEEKDS